jgi:glycyl-tRNA synthetase (class II)
VTIDNPTKDFDLKDDTLTLRERNGSAVWENLRVKFDELPAIIEDLKGYGK